MKRNTSMVLFILLLFISGSVFAAGNYKISGPNLTMMYIPYENVQIDELNANSQSSISYSYRGNLIPKYLTSNTKLSNIAFFLIDSKLKPTTGIKVSRIEIVQNDTLIASANKVNSYSISGFYSGFFEVLNLFQNANEENIVDVVFYLGNIEVA